MLMIDTWYSLRIRMVLMKEYLAVGYWKNRDEIRENWQIGASFAPEMDEEDCKKLLKGWHRAVKCALAWAEDEI